MAAWIAYWPGLFGPFIFDSTVSIRDNALLSFNQFSFAEWYSAALSSETGPLKRPVSMLSFAINAAFVGPHSPFFFKLTNLAIHSLNSVLVYLCARKIFLFSPILSIRRDELTCSWAALLAAAVFLLHPIQLTAVLHAVQRMAQLATTFQLIGLLMFLRCRCAWLTRRPDTNEAFNLCVKILAVSVLGAFAKENALLTPWLVLVVEIYFFRFEISCRCFPVLKYATWLAFVLPLIAVASYCCLINPGYLHDAYAFRGFDVYERLLTEAKVLWIYLYWMVLPAASATGLHHDDIALAHTIWEASSFAAVTAWICVSAFLFSRWSRRWPIPAFAFAWYLVAHAMESTLLPLEIIYEHRNYSAIVGFTIAFGYFVASVLANRSRRMALALAALILPGLGAPLATRASLWSNELTLAENQLAEHPGSLRSRYFYANVNLRIADQSADPETRKRTALTAEYYYRSMLELDAEDLVPLVTLLYIDGRYFAGHRHARLFRDLLSAIDKDTLTPTDYNAMTFFVQCSIRHICVEDRDELESVLRKLDKRPETAETYAQLTRAQYLAGAEGGIDEAANILRRSTQRRPDFFPFYPIMLEVSIVRQDLPMMMETLEKMYQSDSMHSQLRIMRAYVGSWDSQR